VKRVASLRTPNPPTVHYRRIDMRGADEEAIVNQLEATLDLANTILNSVENDAEDAFIKAVGTLAQVMFITVADESREEMIGIATSKLRDYIRLLDEVSQTGLSVMN
jgi:hypothetical protein